MGIETPNGVEFSIGAKMYLCSGRFLQKAGMARGYPSPQGVLVDSFQLAPGILGTTLDWLETNGFAQIWVGVPEGKRREMLMMRAVYSGAPGLSGRFLEATGWKDATVMGAAASLMPFDVAPFIAFLDTVSEEFTAAGILTRGGYAAHGNVWNSEWLGYLQEAWLPEVLEVWQKAHARPDWQIFERVMLSAKEIRRDVEDDD
ncbi:MAG: hypothetical protein JXA36_05015 [Coriobacteriia bacterium]|nr:hypothetical protein [Coriobacteriia bacterium]